MSKQTFLDAVRTAFNEGAEIIRDGAADSLTLADVDAANAALELAESYRTPTQAQIDALAQVAALGWEYVLNVNDEEDPERVWMLDQLGPTDAEETVRWWFTLSVWTRNLEKNPDDLPNMVRVNHEQITGPKPS